MKNTFNNIRELIGNTPLVRINSIKSKGKIYAKLEHFNPGGSIKDRIGIYLLEDAEKRGLIKKGSTIIEATSGNTGVALMLAGLGKGYKYIFVMPDKMSKEKQNFLKAYGAEVVIVPTAVTPDDPLHYNNKAKSLSEEIEDAFLVNQFYNQSNPFAHYDFTGREIWEQTAGKITHFVMGMGTGGTMSGVGKFLKEKNPKIKTIGADPEGSVLAHFHKTGEMLEGDPWKVEGIGEDMIPETLTVDIIDEIHTVSDNDSMKMTRKLAREEGILAGTSTGCILNVVEKIAQDLKEDDIVVFPVADHGDRYLTKVYNDDWLEENDFL
jgi:cystathionine beta-synthase